uniref:Uncharacterized protein n=1 Tax=Rhizophora mucronata TaxID=61149 RepID=A0A2P2QZK9_RHIMU
MQQKQFPLSAPHFINQHLSI